MELLTPGVCLTVVNLQGSRRTLNPLASGNSNSALNSHSESAGLEPLLEAGGAVISPCKTL